MAVPKRKTSKARTRARRAMLVKPSVRNCSAGRQDKAHNQGLLSTSRSEIAANLLLNQKVRRIPFAQHKIYE